MLLFLTLACASLHHDGATDTTSYTLDGVAPNEVREIIVAETASDAVEKASASLPVRVTTTRDGSHSSTTIALGGPVVPAYVAPARERAYAEAAATRSYRDEWMAEQGMIPGSKDPYARVTPPPRASAAPPAASSAGINPSAECPSGKPNPNWTQAELDACQNAAIKAIIKTVGVK